MEGICWVLVTLLREQEQWIRKVVQSQEPRNASEMQNAQLSRSTDSSGLDEARAPTLFPLPSLHFENNAIYSHSINKNLNMEAACIYETSAVLLTTTRHSNPRAELTLKIYYGEKLK